MNDFLQEFVLKNELCDWQYSANKYFDTLYITSPHATSLHLLHHFRTPIGRPTAPFYQAIKEKVSVKLISFGLLLVEAFK
jgi:hypothetical protein